MLLLLIIRWISKKLKGKKSLLYASIYYFWNSPFFPEDLNFLWCHFCSAFFFWHAKNLVSLFLDLCSSWKAHGHSNHCSPVHNVTSFSEWFQDFSVIIGVCSAFWLWYASAVFFIFTLFRVCWASWILTKCGTFRGTISSNIFYPNSLLSRLQ